MSCDNKCKIPVGTTAVNRLTSINKKFFMTGEAPDHADHDIRSGRLIVPEGYQILLGNNSFEHTDTEDEGAEDEEADETVDSISSEGEGDEEELGNESEAIDDDLFNEYVDNAVRELLISKDVSFNNSEHNSTEVSTLENSSENSVTEIGGEEEQPNWMHMVSINLGQIWGSLH